LPNIRRILVPGEWMRAMCEPYWGDRVHAWPVGIDTQAWAPAPAGAREFDVLIYDKIHWDYDHQKLTLLDPIRSHLQRCGLRVATIRYGFYKEKDFAYLLQRSRTMIYLGEHETQGIAYQQTLSCGVPILAWDQGGCWRDPQFGPVTTVPYWDERCGLTFANGLVFADTFDRFWDQASSGRYHPRDYILENLTLEKCALRYVDHWRDIFGSAL
jgi:glycosyltransferase involved in cell wall biosynthesis